MRRKAYQAPKVFKVRLEIKQSILAVCNSSPVSYVAKETYGDCRNDPYCYNAPL